MTHTFSTTQPSHDVRTAAIRGSLFIALMSVAASSWAAIYKCEVNGKKAEYRSTPCPAGDSVAVKVATSPAPASSAPPRLDDRLSVNLPNTPLRVVLQVVADFVGYTLVVDPSVKGEGSFNYQKQAVRVVLADLAQRHGLVVTIAERTITVKRK